MKKIAIVLFLFLVALTFTVTAAAQTTAVHGKANDQAGAPIVGGTVQLDNIESGRKMSVKTDKKGEFYTLGLTPGKYKVTLLGPDGKEMFHFTSVNIGMNPDQNEINFDLKKEAAAAPQSMSEEQKKKLEQAQKENQKIGNLNAMLKQSAELRQAGQCDQAYELMQQASTMDTTHHQIYNSLAESAMCAKKYPEAVAAYKKAVELMPTNAAYYNNMGNALVKANQTDEAITAFNKAAEVDPTKAGDYYFNEGAVLYNKGKMEDAAKAFDKAIQTDPNKADAYFLKGSCMMGQATTGPDGKPKVPAGTAEAFQKYLELDPNGKHVEEAKADLQFLGSKVETTYKSEKKKK